MAQIQINKTDRFRRHLRKKVTCIGRGLSISAIKGRWKGPKVLVNSVPKAGTHLVERALEKFPLLRNAGKKTLSCWDSIDDKTLLKVKRMSNGQFMNAHLTAHEKIFRVIEENNILVLFVVRDPRDVVVSRFKYVSEIDKMHRAHKAFSILNDDNERLMASIEGIQGIVPSIGEMLKRFRPWIEMERVLICRFEDLIGPKGGGEKEKQLKMLSRISRHINIKIDKKELEKISVRTFSSKSSTYRKGMAGGWQKYFNEKHISTFKRVANKELIAYGYEEAENW